MNALEQVYKQFLTNPSVTTDTRKIEKGDIFFALKGASFDGNAFALKALEMGAALAVVDDKSVAGKGVVYVDDALKALQELARMYRRDLQIPVVGLTGTNGKTTSKELIVSVLAQKYRVAFTKGNLNNHIGVPLTVLSIPNDAEIAVIEMGANHPLDIDELTSIAMPNFGLITNVGKAHLEGFGSFEGVKKTKGEMYDYIKAHGGKVFLNLDNQHLVEMANDRMVNDIVPYGVSVMKTAILEKDLEHPFLRLSFDAGLLEGCIAETNLVGDYNADNVMLAVAIGAYFEVPKDKILHALHTYTPDNNRSQLMRTASNLVIVDCYNANPTSMEAALANFTKFNVESKVAILGDMLELGKVSLDEHTKVIEVAGQVGINRLILVGAEFMHVATDLDAEVFESVDKLILHLEMNPIVRSLVLVKGSRGIKLEKTLPLL